MTRISIITVCFNSAATITHTLQSVAAQHHVDIEHLIIDGGSSDGTMDIVQRDGGHVSRTISEPDKGIYDAMNKGMALATGDVVGFLNADDLLASPDSIGAIARATSTANVVYGDLDYVSQDDMGHVVRRWRSGAFHASQLRFGWMPPHPTFYLRRELMKELGFFDTSLRIAADYDYMMRCLTRTSVSVAYVPQVLVKMRLGGVSNRSLRTMLNKSTEDLGVMRRYGIGGWATLAAKNLRKLPQFLPGRLVAKE